MNDRNTTQDWVHIGESEPWYGVLSSPEFLMSNITEAIKQKFYDQGRDEIDQVVTRLKNKYPEFDPTVAIDFGAGLGRLSFAMRNYCSCVYGLEISKGMIIEARNQMKQRNIDGVFFLEKLPDNVGADWINSYIVFQHITPREGYVILENLLKALNPGGYISIQLTFAHDFRDTSILTKDVYAYRYDGETQTTLEHKPSALGQQSMYDYDLNKVLFILIRNSILNLELLHTDHGGVHGFWVFGKKSY